MDFSVKIDILTLFPEMIETVLGGSIIGRARKKGLIDINCVQIRDFAINKHRQVDDYPYGGGTGMVMQAEPIFQAHQSVLSEDEKNFLNSFKSNFDSKEESDLKKKSKKIHTIYMSPQGRTFRQSTAKRLCKYEHLILICGHYEGVDQRVLDEICDEEISIGDFVLTGGEIAAAAIVDATARLIPGVLKSEESFSEESHYNGLLEYPQYTRPEEWHNRTVPDVLLSGHHKNICDWKRKMSIKNTFLKRRGMLSKAKLTDKEKAYVNELKNNEE